MLEFAVRYIIIDGRVFLSDKASASAEIRVACSRSRLRVCETLGEFLDILRLFFGNG
jgi:hypothetical protein